MTEPPAPGTPAPLPQPGSLWASLTRDPMTGVAIMDHESRILYLNAQSARIYFGPDAKPQDVLGKTNAELYPESFTTERQSVIDKVLSTNRPVLFRTVWRGRQHLAWVYPIHPEPGDGQDADGPNQVLVITRLASGSAEAQLSDDRDIELMESQVNDLGELGVLSPRELVVLALLGQGLSVKEVAAKVHRSDKTIQTQRDSIARKLGLRNRGELVKLVQQIGLTVADADRLDIDPDAPTSPR